jgi:oligopeptidase B
MNPPITKTDDYYWMRSDDRSNEQVLEHLKNENAITQNKMADTAQLQEQLKGEMKSRMNENDSSYPHKFYHSDYYHYRTFSKGNGYRVYHRTDKNRTSNEILLDANLLFKEKEFCDLSEVTTSHDSRILTYAVDYSGNEQYTIYFKDLQSGKMMDHRIENLMYADYMWSPSNRHVYCVGHDDALKQDRIYVYDLNDKSTKTIYKEDDPLFSVGSTHSDDLEYIFVSSESSTTSEVYYINPSYDTHKTNFLIRTNADGATNFKLMLCDKKTFEWKNFIPYDERVYITGVTVLTNYIVLSVRVNGLTNIGIINRSNPQQITLLDNSNDCHYISLSGEHMMDCNTDTIIYEYESMTQPRTLISHSLATNQTTILQQKTYPNYDPSLYESVMLYAPTHDNKDTIPISVVYKKEFKDKVKPAYVYGYGAYGSCSDPYFSPNIVSLLDRSFMYCIAHVRGGSEKGYSWYLDGKMANKMNTFRDFISCTEFLARLDDVDETRIVVEGRSAGGLLMGGILTQRPDLFRSVLAVVPFVDVLTTMADSSIPLTVPEWEEWGNPNIKKDYKCMKEYSPYDNLKRTNYPHTLITCGLSDPRVQYWEPTKFQAKLKEYCTDSNTHLLKIDMDKGHFTETDRYKAISEKAFEFAFVLKSVE